MIKYLAIAALVGATVGTAVPAGAVDAYLFTVVTKAEGATVRATDPKTKNTAAITVKANASNVIYIAKAASYTLEITVCGKTNTFRDVEAKLTSTTLTVAGCNSVNLVAK